jgi:hypothetical protein
VTAVRDPITPVDCDLQDYPSMLVDVVRVRDSSLASDESPEACWAAFLLWCAAWHQVPAASIPDTDSWIAKQAGYALRGKIDKAWKNVRDGALRGFVRCSDGRLYHPVVAEKALECWIDKLGRAISSGNGNAKRWGGTFDPAPIEGQIAAAKALLKTLNPHSRALSKRRHSAVPHASDPDPAGTPGDLPSGSQGKGREEKGSKGNSYSAPIGADDADAPSAVDKSSPKSEAEEAKARALWRDAGTWLMENDDLTAGAAKAFINKVAKDHGSEVCVEAFTEAIKTQAPAGARPLATAIAQRLTGVRHAAPKPVTVESGAVEATQQYLREKSEHTPTPPPADAAERLAATRALLAGRTGATTAPQLETVEVTDGGT